MQGKERFVAKTYAGLEQILKEELEQLGAENCRIGTRAVEFEGDISMLYRANYYCRFALRIHLPGSRSSVTFYPRHFLLILLPLLRWNRFDSCVCLLRISDRTDARIAARGVTAV